MKRSELRHIIREEIKKVNEVDHDSAMNAFYDELKKHTDIKKAAKHYNVTIDKILTALYPRIKILRYKDKSIKEVSIDFKDKDSGMQIKHKKTFKQDEIYFI